MTNELEKIVNNLGAYTSDAIIITKADRLLVSEPEIVWCNEEFLQACGFTTEELLGNPYRMLTGDNTSGETMNLIRQSLENWEPCHTELLIYRKDGSPFWVDISIRPAGKVLLENQTGERSFPYWVITQRDIDIQKRLEKELMESFADTAEQAIRLEALSDNVPGALYEFRMDADGRFSFPYISQGFEDFFQAPNGTFTTDCESIFGLIEKEDRSRVIDSIAKSALGLTRWSERFRINRETGQRWVEGQSIPRKLENENAIVWYGYFHDVTKSVDRELALEKAKCAAEEANRAKSHFLGSMSHELRTPLNVIIGMADLLGDSLLEEEQHKQVSYLKSAGQSLLRIISDILDYSRIESGSIPVIPAPINLLAITGQVKRAWEAQAKKKGLTFTVTVSARELRMGDSERIKQILHNLIGNAIKFTDEGEVSVEISTNPGQENEVLLKITDTGCGIPDSFMPDLFKQFSQSENALSRNHGGSGLGLAITKGLVESMHGHIDAESEVGKGSHFFASLRLPLVASRRSTRSPLGEAAKKRILYIEDDPGNRIILGSMLRKESKYEVSFAKNGMDGIEAYKKGRFDLILMDIRMPQMNGARAYQKMRDWEAKTNRSSVPIVALTGQSLPEEVKSYINIGFDGVITKPYFKETLLREVAKALSLETEA